MIRGILEGRSAILFILMAFLMPNVFAASGDISITFHDKELHDDSVAADDYTKSTFANAGYSDASVNPLNTSAVLRFDGNADGDLKDSFMDYDLYNYIVMVDMPNGDIQFAYKLTEHSTYSNGDGNIDAGEVVIIKGDKYVVTDNETSNNDIELGPAIAKSLTADTLDKDNAVVVSGTKKILYGVDGTLRFYAAGSLVESPVSLSGISSYPYELVSDKFPWHITSDEFKSYNIYVIYADGSTAKVIFVEKSQLVKLTNDEEGVMGYSSIKVGDTDWYNDGLYLLSDPISLPKGETIDLADTYYQLKYTTSKQFDILRKKVSAVVSGTKLKPTTAPGEDFLKESIIVTVIPTPTIPSCGYAVSADMILTSSLSGCSGSGLIMAADNIILDCAGYSITGAPGTTGISISGKNNITVKNCVLKSFDMGIDISNSDNSRIINNTMTNWGILGIKLTSSNYNTIANNSVSSKSTYGIVQYTSNYNLILNNTVTGNVDKGIYITGTPPGGWGSAPSPCSHSNISGNVVSNNGYGIYLDNEDNNLVTENYVYANTIYGIYLNGSWLNSVYDNHLNNTNNAYDTGSLTGPNYWNTDKRSGTNIVDGPYLGGNFWARPDGTGFSETCTDADGDEICDSVYTLTSANVDYLPLAFKYLDATIYIAPDILNLKSKGRRITAYIELPEGYDAADINVSTVLLGGTVPAKMRPVHIGDYDRDGIPDLMVKFDMADVADLIKALNSDLPTDVELTVAGSLADDTRFKGSDTIRAIEGGRMMRNPKMRGGGRRGGSGGMHGSGAGIAPVPVASPASSEGNYDSGNYDVSQGNYDGNYDLSPGNYDTTAPDKGEQKTKRKRMMWR
ncbi:MAG: NosD domain-containing protein [Candidatus Hydrothermarchaeaceae archaeon]